jgi:C4-dicarboxylate transporter DctQ subunit
MTRIERWLAHVENAFAALAIAILIACTVAVCADVILRYAFNRPLMWVAEITEYALVYITFLGIAWAVPRRGHVVVDVVTSNLPPRGQAACGVFNNIVALIVSVMLVIWGTTTTLDAFSRGLFKPTTLAMPTWIALAVIPLGCAILAVRFAVETWRSTRQLATGRAEQGPAATASLE